jgi:hypothetical protein
MSIPRYALGAASLLITTGALGWSAYVLRKRWLPALAGAPARLAESIYGIALLVALAELLGAIGWLRLGPITVGAGVIALIATKTGGMARDEHPRGARVTVTGHVSRLSLAVGAITALLVTAAWAAPTLESFDYGIRGFDSLWYHLPFAASFAQTGQITSLRFVDVEYLSQFYPATSELIHAIGIVLLGRDTLSPALNMFWLALTLLAAYCIGRPRGLGALTASGAALACVTKMMVSSQAGAAANDIVGVFFLLAAVALWVNADGSRAAFVLAAVAAGLAVGTKLSLLAPIAALTVAAIALGASGRRRRGAIDWLLPLAIAGGYWYVRDLIAVGNPLPWTSLGGLLPTPTAPLQQSTGFSVVHYLSDTHVWTRLFGPGLVAGLGPWWPLVVAGMIAGPLLCLAWPTADRRTRALGAIALCSLLGYLITPETAAGPPGDPLGFAFNLRYAAPALVLSLTVLPLAPPISGDGRARGLTAVGLGVVFLLTVIHAHLWSTPWLPGALVVAVVAGAVAVAVARGVAPGRGPALALAGGLIAVVVVAGYPIQRHYLDGRYSFQPGVSALSREWALFRGIHDSRIGIAGTFGAFQSYPFYGVDDSNRVQYVAARGSHGSFTPIRTCSAWRAAVNAGRYGYVVTTPGRNPWHPKPLSRSPERGWLVSDPVARIIYQRRAFGQPIDVFELSGPLNPAGC